MTKRDRCSLLSCCLVSLLLQACASFSPPREVNTDFLDRAKTQKEGKVSVTAVVLSDRESAQVFASKVAKRDIQAVWLEIDNKGDGDLMLMLPAVDPDYFSPSEAAWRSRRLWERRSWEKMEYFSNQHVPIQIPSRTKVGGYVLTNHDPGLKAFTVQLIGDRESHRFDFEQLVPGLSSDFERSRALEIHAGEELPDLGLEGLKAYLEELPCCVLGGDRKTPGDPLNIVIVGEGAHGLAAFARRRWDVTETLKFGSAWRMVISSLFKSTYRTSPVSPLYVFDRPHDVALQKTRGNVDERNHLRFWKAPVTYLGTSVWVGQISHDIGVKLTRRTIVTHKIDPDVDEARAYLMQDIIRSSSIKEVGFVKGVGPSSRDAPRTNYTHDPYITDGLRLVLFLGEERTEIDEIDWLDWEWPSGDFPGVVNTPLR
jgi:hypothetical protein